MTHLNIEQNTGITEEVNGSIIQKLYETAVEGNLDSSSNLKGRLHTTVAYEKFITGLTNKFNELYINADNMYAWFEDDEVRTLLANSIGDGTGVTISVMQSLNRFPSNIFAGNTSIETFDELPQFTNITTIDDQSRVYFKNCTNLKSIDLSNITSIGGDSNHRNNFENCSNLEEVGDTSNITFLGVMAFYNCTKLKSIDVSNVTQFRSSCFYGCTGLTNTFSLNQNITDIESRAFGSSSVILPEIINLPHLQNLGGRCFHGVNSIKHVQNLGVITTIGSDYSNDGQFNDCKGLLDVVIPETVTTVRYGLFLGCTNLRWVKILSTTLPTYNTITGLGNTELYGRAFGESYNNSDPTDTYKGATYPIYVRDDLLSQYQADDKWSKVGPGRLRALSQFSTDFPNE